MNTKISKLRGRQWVEKDKRIIKHRKQNGRQ